MSIELMCSVCSAVNAFTHDQAGCMGKCGQCQTPLYIPRPDEMPAAIKRPGARGAGGIIGLVLGGVALLILLALGSAVGGYFLLFGKKASAGSADTLQAAKFVKLAASTSASDDGELAKPKDEASFKFHAPAAGTVAVYIDPADGGKLDGRLWAYDVQHRELVRNDDDPDKRTGEILIPVAADQDYFVKVAGADNSAGKFKLTLKHIASLSGNFADAQEVRLSRTGLAYQTWTMERAGDENAFSFKATLTGWMFVEVGNPLGGNLDGTVTAFDETKLPVTPGTYTNRINRFHVDKDKTYYVKVGSNPNPFYGLARTGAYSISFRTVKTSPDDHGNDFASAQKVLFDAFGGSATLNGQIENDLDIDFFVFQAPRTGTISVNLNNPFGSQLDAACWGYSDTRQEVLAGTRTGTMFVTEGKTYYLKVLPYSFPLQGKQKTGAYTLQLSTAGNNKPNGPKGAGKDFASAQQLTLSALGSANSNGNLLGAQDAAFYRFSATKTGTMVIELIYPPGSQLDAGVYAFGSTYLATGVGNGTTIVDVQVTAGQTYYVKVAPMPNPLAGLAPSGDYNLKLWMDIKGQKDNSDFGKAQQVFLNAAGATDVNSQLDKQTDVDMFRFQAAKDGLMVVELNRAPNSNLAAMAYAYDSLKNSIGAGSSQTLEFKVASGNVYYVKVAPQAFPPVGQQKTGAYSLAFRTENVQPDDYGNDFTTAHEIFLNSGSATLSGRIEVPGDIDFFRWKATEEGWLDVQLQYPPSAKQLDGKINTYDAARRELARPFPVDKDQVYYIKVSSWTSPLFGLRATGPYTVYCKFSKTLPDDYGNDFNTAHTITLFATGMTSRFGRIETADDVDCFQFKAASTGDMKIALKPSLGSRLNSLLAVYDDNQNLLRESRQGIGRSAQVAVLPGKTYYVKVSANPDASPSEKRGSYTLELNPSYKKTAAKPPPVATGKQKEYSKQIDDWTAKILVNGDDYYNYSQRGEAYRMRGDLDKAITDFTTAIQLNNNDAFSYASRGAAYRTKNDLDKATADLDTAIRLNPNNDFAWSMRGDLRRTRSDFDNAIDDLNEALRINPRSDYAFASRGASYRMKRDLPKALEDLNKAIEINSKNDFAFSQRGSVYEMKRDYDRAVDDFNTAVQLNARNDFAFSERGNIFRLRGSYDKAIDDCSVAIDLNPKDYFPYGIRGESYRMKGMYDKALDDLNTSLGMNPKDTFGFACRGALYSAQGNTKAALQDLNRAIQLDPNYVFAYRQRSIVYTTLGNFSQASADTEKANSLEQKK